VSLSLTEIGRQPNGALRPLQEPRRRWGGDAAYIEFQAQRKALHRGPRYHCSIMIQGGYCVTGLPLDDIAAQVEGTLAQSLLQWVPRFPLA
jgi:hypothetical protein